MHQYSLRSKMVSSALALIMVLGIINIPVLNVRADGDPITVSSWNDLAEAVRDNDNCRIVLTGSFDMQKTVGYIPVGSGKDITLDLNGYYIKGIQAATPVGDNFFIVGGTEEKKGRLTLEDSSENKTGSLTGIYGACAVRVDQHGEFIMNGGTISKNTNASNFGGGVFVRGGSFTMNGGYIDHNNVYPRQTLGGEGGGVCVKNGGSFVMNYGVIKSNGQCNFKESSCPKSGGGVFVDKGCSFVMTGGRIGGVGSVGTDDVGGNIVQTNSKNLGGGVYVAGEFTMTGGEIFNNTASTAGAGVYVAAEGSFVLDGGTINENKVTGGVYLECGDNEKPGGDFLMKSGLITDCHSGGGVVIEGTDQVYANYKTGTFKMTGGTITDCSRYKGGGVMINPYASFIMTGGTISNCYAGADDESEGGGGVYVSTEAVFTMEGGSLTGNNSSKHGGGVYLQEESTFNLKGGSITGNFVEPYGSSPTTTFGGGVYVDCVKNNFTNFNITGDSVVVIKDNKAKPANNPECEQNVYLCDSTSSYYNNDIHITGTLKDGTRIGVTEPDHGTLYEYRITRGYSENNKVDGSLLDPNRFFFSDQDGLIVEVKNNEAYLAPHTHELQYDVSGSVLNITCKVTQKPCDMSASLEIDVDSGIATGSPVTATLKASELFELLTGVTLDESKIVYINKEDNSSSTTAPSTKGDYTASYTETIGGNDYTITKDFSLTDCTVNFDLNYPADMEDPSGTTPKAQEIIYGGIATEPTPAPEETGWIFGGWFTDAACADTDKFDFSTQITGDTTLYAKWVKCDHTNHTGTPAYDWSDDYSSCIATLICDCGEKIEENGNVQEEVTTQPTYTDTGVITFTATFNNSLFSTQSKTKTIPVKAFTFDVDFGEDHIDFVNTYYGAGGSYATSGKYPVNGSKVTFIVPYGSTVQDAMDAIELADGMRGTIDNGLKFPGVFGLKTADKYAALMEYETEADSWSSTNLEEGTVLYAIWQQRIDKVDITVKVPDCKTEVTLEDATGTSFPVSVLQTNTPQITVIGNVGILSDNVPGMNDAWWLKKKEFPKSLGKDVLFEGTMLGGNAYYVEIPLMVNVDGYFDQTAGCAITVNGVDVDAQDINLTTINAAVLFEINVEHKAGEAARENEVAATCEADGSYDEVVRCTICNGVVSSKTFTVDKKGHDYDDGVVTTEPSCEKPGVKTFTCKNDKTHTYTEEIQATGHNWSNWKITTKATVDNEGEQTRTCSGCGKVEKKTVAKLTPTPTSKPTATPTKVPTKTPTKAPTATPTAKPSVSPTKTPTKAPTATPTAKPTAKPTATTKPQAPVTLSLNKSSVSLVCGKTAVIKATLTGSSAKIDWKSSDPKVAAVDATGKITAKMAGTVTITASAAGKIAKCTVTVLYKDVNNPKEFWYAPTNYMTAKGVVKGYDKQTRFKPGNVCTRAQMVTFIWRLAGQPAPKAKTCKFTDVKKSDYFYKACIWGNEKHIVEGYKDGTFGPQIVCARRHAVTFLWRLAGKPAPKNSKNKFSDVKKSDYFYSATLWASEKGILAGYADGTFRPNGDCLRRQMVTFLYKYDKFISKKG